MHGSVSRGNEHQFSQLVEPAAQHGLGFRVGVAISGEDAYSGLAVKYYSTAKGSPSGKLPFPFHLPSQRIAVQRCFL